MKRFGLLFGALGKRCKAKARNVWRRLLLRKPIDRLVRVKLRYRIARAIDSHAVLGYFFGTFGSLWLPIVISACVLWLRDEKPSCLWYAIGTLAVVQTASALVAHGAKKFAEAASGVASVLALQAFLDWMHGTVFSGNTTVRITVMVPVEKEEGTVLRVLLRPAAFEGRSSTELAVNTTTGVGEGAAGMCYCGGSAEEVVFEHDPDESPERLAEYAKACHMPIEKARLLKRKARYYFALAIEDINGPRIGVLVIDNARSAEILVEESGTACDRATQQTKLLLQWVTLLLRSIPRSIRDKA